MITLNEAIEEFSQLPEEVQLACSTAEVFKALAHISKTYNLDLSSVLVVYVVGELKDGDISSYLIDEYGVSEENVKNIVNTLQRTLLTPIFEYLEFINAHPNKTMSLEGERGYAEEIFRSKIIAELNHHPMLTAAVNMRLFYILARDESFKTRLTQALLANEEVVSKNTIMLNGQSVAPTVANWLKAYIAKHGAESHDSVSQSDFLINSENGTTLSDDERSLVAHVLKTYCNIAFFPDSMPSDDGTAWHIIPSGDETLMSLDSDDEEDEDDASLPGIGSSSASFSPENDSVPHGEFETDKSSMPRSEEQPIPTPAASAIEPKSKKQESVPEEEGQTIPEMTPEDINDQEPSPDYVSNPTDELTELRNAQSLYPAGSLERKAIDEEIKRLSGSL